MPVVIGGDNLPSPVGIGLTDLPNIGGPVAPLPPVPTSLYRVQTFEKRFYLLSFSEHWNFLQFDGRVVP